MRVLLDTHAPLRWFTDDPRLSRAARQVIADEANSILVSAASAWEISTKHRPGKLNEAADAVNRFDELVAADRFDHLPIAHFHRLKTGGYPVEHRNPFDRMLGHRACSSRCRS